MLFNNIFVVFAGSFQEAGVIQAAYELNNPLQVHPVNMATDLEPSSFVSIDTPSVIMEAMKKVGEIFYGSNTIR